jgi:hypothetical protein
MTATTWGCSATWYVLAISGSMRVMTVCYTADN